MKRKLTQKDKARIRKSPEWSQLKIDVAEKFNHKDPITGETLRKGWNLHHLDMSDEHYDDLSIEDPFGNPRFIPLNRSTHDYIHALFRSMTRKKAPRDMEKYFSEMLKYLSLMKLMNKGY